MSMNITDMPRLPLKPLTTSPLPQARFEHVSNVDAHGNSDTFPDIPGATKENTSYFATATTELPRSFHDSLTLLQEYGFIPPADEASETVNQASGTQPEEADATNPIADGSDRDDII